MYKGNSSSKWTRMAKNQSEDKDFIFVGFCTLPNVQREKGNVWNSPAVTWSGHHFELTHWTDIFSQNYHVIVLYLSNSSNSVNSSSAVDYRLDTKHYWLYIIKCWITLCFLLKHTISQVLYMAEFCSKSYICYLACSKKSRIIRIFNEFISSRQYIQASC